MANADTLDGAGVNSGNALDAAKVQQNSETTKDKNKNNKAHSYEVTKIELLDGLSNSPRLEMVESNPSISVAKVQQNFETAKDLAKKHCHRRVAEHELNRASQQQQPKKIEKQRDFKAPQALSGDTELTARAANVLNSAAKVQQNSEITKLSSKKEPPPFCYTTPH